MHFYLPRRHRRRLLLPPGLVALAGLLLLGCLALRPWQERLSKKVAFELTMPPINKSRTTWPVEHFEAYDSLMLKEPKLSYSNVLTYRKWITISFGQGQRLDTLATVLAGAAARPAAGVAAVQVRPAGGLVERSRPAAEKQEAASYLR